MHCAPAENIPTRYQEALSVRTARSDSNVRNWHCLRRDKDEFSRALSLATETPRKQQFQDARLEGAGSCLHERHWQHTSDQEVPLSQLYTLLAAGGPRQYGLPTVAGHVKTNLA